MAALNVRDMSTDPVLLGAYAARSCPVKTQNAFDPTVALRPGPVDEALPERFEGGEQFEDEVFAALRRAPNLRVLDLRGLADRHSSSGGSSSSDRLSSSDLRSSPDWQGAAAATASAVRDGVDVVLAATLPPDPAGRRIGVAGMLVRGLDRTDGRPGYHPVEVKAHKVLERRPSTTRVSSRVNFSVTALHRPAPQHAQLLDGARFRVGSREADLVQLAHYWRLLEAAGWSADSRRAAVIGTDGPEGEPVLAWVDLDEPLVRTFSRSAAEGWALRSVLQRYDHEHAFRVAVAERARQQTGRPGSDPPRLVAPIVVPECGRCPWWEHCWPQLPDDDIGLRIDKSPLDPREIKTLRAAGVVTVTDLAAVDLDALLPRYLPEVSHRPGAEPRLRLAQRRSRMLAAGVTLERVGDAPVEVPGAVLEIDLDIETSPDGRVYLWGFGVSDNRDGSRRFVHVSRFADLSAAAEVSLARAALGWLQETVTAVPTRVYHYSEYELTKITELAERSGDPLLSWAAGYAREHFVDLLPVVQAHFFGVRGLGLKQVATAGAGFRWRDEDPGGLNSQRWFLDAVHGETAALRAAARTRVLEYNEDDVDATAAVRRWLRELSRPAQPAAGPASVAVCGR